MSVSSASGIRGNRLKALREAKRLSQEELAARAGTDKRQLLRHEKNEAEPSASLLKEYAFHLETTTDYLVGLTDDETPRTYENELSKEERELILALRQRRTSEAVQSFAALSKPS